MADSKIAQRLVALRRAIQDQDWDGVRFHFDNVVRGVGRLVADVEFTRLPDEEVWEPLQEAEKVPLTEAQRAALAARGGDAALIDELRVSEMWKNSLYTVMVTRRDDGSVAELSIRRNDRQPVHDWRHFQMIKTEIAGPDAEAFELYPAESRLMDTANQYYLFVCQPGRRLDAGYMGPRLLVDADEQDGTGAVQRALPDGWVSTFAEVYGAQKEAQQ